MLEGVRFNEGRAVWGRGRCSSSPVEGRRAKLFTLRAAMVS